MKHQPWDLNQTWAVGQKRCRFTNTSSSKKVGGSPPNFGWKEHQIFDHFFATSALDTAYFRNDPETAEFRLLIVISDPHFGGH